MYYLYFIVILTYLHTSGATTVASQFQELDDLFGTVSTIKAYLSPIHRPSIYVYVLSTFASSLSCDERKTSKEENSEQRHLEPAKCTLLLDEPVNLNSD